MIRREAGWLIGINDLSDQPLLSLVPCDTGSSSGTIGETATPPDYNLFGLAIDYDATYDGKRLARMSECQFHGS